MKLADLQRASRRNLCLILLLILVLAPFKALALTDNDCMDCHSDPDLTTEKDGKTISLYVDEEVFKGTVHAENGCISCHEEADVEGDEHPFPMAPVNCGNCHDDIAKTYANSLHGKAVAAKDPFAPYCSDCHGKHNIYSPSDKRSNTYILNIPFHRSR